MRNFVKNRRQVLPETSIDNCILYAASCNVEVILFLTEELMTKKDNVVEKAIQMFDSRQRIPVHYAKNDVC